VTRFVAVIGRAFLAGRVRRLSGQVETPQRDLFVGKVAAHSDRAEEALKGHKYSSKVQQRRRRLVMLSGLQAAHRTPSMFASPVAGHLELTQVLAFVFV
jgi:hypothetical protein